MPVIIKESYVTLRELHDKLLKHLRALQNLGLSTETWDALIIYIVSVKLDCTSQREWETCIASKNELPTLNEFTEFLNERCRILEAIKPKINQVNKPVVVKNKMAALVASAGSQHLCQFCGSAAHAIYKCESFAELAPNVRIDKAKQSQLCINCLRKGHRSNQCKSTMLCKHCQRKHNSLLHLDFGNKNNASNNANSNPNTSDNVSLPSQGTSDTSLSHHAISKSLTSQIILLSTACVYVKDVSGQQHLCRILLDSGSQANFITKALQEKLGLPVNRISSTVIGINQSCSSVTHKTQVDIQSRVNQFKATLQCLIVPKITENMPAMSFSATQLNIPQNIKMADPNFNVEGKIDMLLGASIFWQLICIGQITTNKNHPTLQKTKLGWIISGPFSIMSPVNITHCGFTQNLNLEQQLERFWDIDDCLEKRVLSEEEQQCETHFKNTTRRDQTGRFVISIPFKQNKEELGNTRDVALKRFYSLERRLNREPELKKDYAVFLQEYENAGHMVRIDESREPEEGLKSYLPHHAVIKHASTTSKTRVVFDASVKSDSGLSLNDIQLIGPVVQNDLFTVILRFRRHSYVITADVEKMYRQILVSGPDRRLQRIFWRSDSSEEVQCFELQTVTYGTSSAPYLATRCLQQLSFDHQAEHPTACEVIRNDFYVDDLLSGAETIETLLQLKHDVSQILQSARFHLRKWLSNEPQIVSNSVDENANLTFGINNESKTLGVLWNANSDSFKYTINMSNQQGHITKRTILSITGQVFDPLGLLSPVLIIAKLIIQELWQFELSWDESVPNDVHTKWLKFREEIEILNNLKIPRHIVEPNANNIQIHGFADASERAFGACVYIRSSNNANNGCTIRLACAKSRVAPLRQISLPRLELCAAVLLSNLMQKVCNSLGMQFNNYYYWTDSQIVLCWIKSSCLRWQTFVANRVATIQRTSDVSNWHHVKSNDNPADLISRGVTPSQILESRIWWCGPSWLANDQTEWPLELSEMEINDVPEARMAKMSMVTTANEFELFTRYSSLPKLVRVFAWMLRFIHNMRSEIKRTEHLSVRDLDQALIGLIKIAQGHCFTAELRQLTKTKSVNSKRPLLSLNPFIDKNSLLRVGGRIKLANFSYDKTHPILLPQRHALTTLIVENEHNKNLHCGAHTLLSILRERYWPIAGKNLVKKITRGCVVCFKANPKAASHLMGDLPAARLSPAPVFYNCGLDYAGPFMLKDKRSRGNKSIKAYICLFVCLATKAVHLELVGNLTTEAFLACFRRFIARRGKPLNLYSDNATNFTGAYAEFKEFSKFINERGVQEQITNSLSNEGIAWHFIPPRSPHFGGLWEAGIKSAKSHLKRVIGNASLVFEDFYTILTQVEAILNSRPLYPMSSDPNDLNPLTPGHFLIGQPLTALPERDLRDIKENRLSQFQRLQQLIQHFWSRWSKEYVAELQTRTKWKRNSATLLKEGSLVIIREDNQPPLKWQLGRVLQLHIGNDGIARVADIQTVSSVLKRAVNKLCVLPSPRADLV